MALKALPKQSGEYLLEMVMRRYENRSTIMTTNRPLEECQKLLSNVPTARPILDKFLPQATLVVIRRRSYRIKNSMSASLPDERSAKSKEPSTAGAASWDSQPSPAHLSGRQTP